jgi:hypothetical protein
MQNCEAEQTAPPLDKRLDNLERLGICASSANHGTCIFIQSKEVRSKAYFDMQLNPTGHTHISSSSFYKYHIPLSTHQPNWALKAHNYILVSTVWLQVAQTCRHHIHTLTQRHTHTCRDLWKVNTWLYMNAMKSDISHVMKNDFKALCARGVVCTLPQRCAACKKVVRCCVPSTEGLMCFAPDPFEAEVPRV